MPIPTGEEALDPVLTTLGDNKRHDVTEIRRFVRFRYKVTLDELQLMPERGSSTVFVNHVAWALSYLGTKNGPHGHSLFVTKIKKGVYKITDHGLAYLKTNPGQITLKDLKEF